jgi:hypothetical protein
MAFPINVTFAGTDGQNVATYDTAWTANRGTMVCETTGTDYADRAMADTGNDADYRRNDTASTADAYARATYELGNGSVSAYIWVNVRMNTASGIDAYVLFAQAGTLELGKNIAGSFTSLGTGQTFTVDGQTFEVRAVGTTITGWKNGSQVYTVTDTSLTTGYVGIGGYGYSGDVNHGIERFEADAVGGAAATSFAFRPGARAFGGLIVR